MRHLMFLVAILGLAWATSAPAADAPAPGKMNVLLLISDDLTTALGCYGHPLVKSPHIDRLAARGVKFERAYCQFPLCNPSRCSFMTGRRPDTTRVYDNGVNFRENLPDIDTLPQHFRKGGYFAARVGKIYHYGVPSQIGTDGMDDPTSWNQVVNPSGRDKDEEKDVINFTGGGLGSSLCWLQTGGTGEDHTDGKVADATIKILEENQNRPFFLACGFYRPHVPCVASENFFAQYPLNQIKLPQEPAEHLAEIPPGALTVVPPNYGLDVEKLTIFTRAYHASNSLMDAQFGRVLDALRQLELADRTIVVFFSDHGWCLGQHGQWQKRLLFEESARVPLIIYDPRAQGNGQPSPRTVELVDVFPTLADLCGLPAPTGTEGKSLRPLLDDPRAAWDKPAMTQVTHGQKGSPAIMGRSIRTERWRYSSWDSGRLGEELYDHDADPHEYCNLAHDPNYAQVVAQLKTQLPKETFVSPPAKKKASGKKKT